MCEQIEKNICDQQFMKIVTDSWQLWPIYDNYMTTSEHVWPPVKVLLLWPAYDMCDHQKLNFVLEIECCCC